MERLNDIFLTDAINSMPGYKLSETHFRLGSKIHISDFYYVKRFFQNSFFASRIAFSLAREIINRHQDCIASLNKKDDGGLTLIGYGLYSELLLSLIEKFLKKRWPNAIINHDLISDVENLQRVKRYEHLHQNVILIVPIASTFYTSIKIEKKLKEELEREKNIGDLSNKTINFLSPTLNAILIHNNPLPKGNIKEGLIERKFGWLFSDPLEKLVQVKAFFESDEHENIREQKYLLRLSTVWHSVDNCNICYPEDALKEKPLFLTDNTSVTPVTIFDYPKGRELTADAERFYLDDTMLDYGHWVGGTNHYHYFIRVEDFFRANSKGIIRWLKKLKMSTSFKNIYNESDNIIIIAPENYTNAGFVNLINEELFSDAATIIHYDPTKDDIQNFMVFYGHEISKASKVFFVDDVITSGNSFLKTNYFVKHTRSGPEKQSLGIDACFFMLDRSSHFVHENVKRKVKNGLYFSFANLHLPTLKTFNGKCPLCEEEARYKELANSSVLDKLKCHFLQQALKVKHKDVSRDRRTETSVHSIDGFYFTKRVDLIHRIHEWFAKAERGGIEDYSYGGWKTELFSMHSPFLKEWGDDAEHEGQILTAVDFPLLKVLTQPPFIHYEPLRKKTFTWVLELLEGIKIKTLTDIQNDKYNYQTFRQLKFLIRRAGLLNANYIIKFPSPEDKSKGRYLSMLALIRYLYTDPSIFSVLAADSKQASEPQAKDLFTGDPEQKAQKRKSKSDVQRQIAREKRILQEIREQQAIAKSVDHLPIFIAAQIKELLHLNEARAVNLESEIISLEQDNSGSPAFKQILRIIREENGLLIHKYWQFLVEEVVGTGSLVSDGKTILSNTDIIAAKLKSSHGKDDYKYDNLYNFFNASKEFVAPETNVPFLNYLWLKEFLRSETRITVDNEDLSLEKKTGIIMSKLKTIITPNSNRDVGAFLVIKRGQNTLPFFAYNTDLNGSQVSEADCYWESPDSMSSNFLSQFLDIANDATNFSRKSVVELHKEGENWQDLYSTKDSPTYINFPLDLLPAKFNRLVLFRINKRYLRIRDSSESETIEEPQAILGFLLSLDAPTTYQLINIRYVLLLRGDISEFIKNHHENNEFSDWIAADTKQRTALLTGHGREMLMAIASKHEGAYQNIISTILLVQRFLIDLEEEDKWNSEDNIIRKYFRGYYSRRAIDNPISDHVIHSLKTMARNIFDFEEIENQDNLKEAEVILEQPIEKFQFPVDLFNMLFFELIVNAKKNRWLFSDEETLTKANMLWIKAAVAHEKSPRELHLSISNTGPAVEEETIDKLNNNQPVKGYKSVAGLELLRNVVQKFKLGEFGTFECLPYLEGPIYKFTINILLYEWEEENSDNRQPKDTI